MSLRADGHAAVDWVFDYLERVEELPVLAQVEPGDVRRSLPASLPVWRARSAIAMTA